MSEQHKPQSIGEVAHDAGVAARDMAAKAFQGLKDFGENVADASKDLFASTKLNSERSDLQKKLDEAYKKLGTLAYQSGDLTGEMASVAEEIHAMYKKMQDIEMELNEK